jgi:hypothetical protein
MWHLNLFDKLILISIDKVSKTLMFLKKKHTQVKNKLNSKRNAGKKNHSSKVFRKRRYSH